MSTPSGPYDQTPRPAGAGEYGQNPPPYPGYQPYPGAPTQPNPYPYGQPGMPTYPQPYPPQPYGAPYPGYPVAPPKNSNKTPWIVLSVVGGVLLLACISCAALVFYLGSQVASSPLFGSTLTATSFCTDAQTQNYSEAYKLLSSNLQNQIGEDQFVQDNQNADSASGTVTACAPSPSDQTAQSSSSVTSVSFTVAVTRGASSAGSAGGDTGSGSGGTTTTGTMTLIKENGSWKVDSIDSSLGLT
jgi:hypothetical protein